MSAGTLMQNASKLLSKIQVALGQHWLIVGATGTGKTFFLTKLLYLLFPAPAFAGAKLYILDEKDEGDYEEFPGHVRSGIAPGLLPDPTGPSHPVQVWHPGRHTPIQEIEAWLDNIFYDGPAVLVVDELVDLIYGARTYSEALKELLKKGRGKGITVIVLTQEVAEIDRRVIGQTSHWVRFVVGNEYDSRLLDRKMKNEQGEPGGEWGFFYNNRWLVKVGDPARYFSDVKRFLGKVA